MINAGVMSSARGDWCTPKPVLDLVNRVLFEGICLDPCSNEQSIVGALAMMTTRSANDGGLGADWALYGDTVYVNPPYGRGIGEWVTKCMVQSEENPSMEIIALLPARPDTKWFQHAWSADAICFWRGRIKFIGAKSGAPFPSAVCYWGPNRYTFATVFCGAGAVVMP